MACSGEDCQWLVYRAVNVHIVKEKFTGGDDACDQKVRKELASEIRAKLKQTIKDQAENTAPCADKQCECMIDDYDDDEEGWADSGEGRWTDTVSSGACSLKATITYKRQSKKITGHCYKPLPKSPQPEDSGEDKPVKSKKDE